MISTATEKSINEQINAELFSFYLYLAMSTHFQHANFGGFAKWMRTQAQEEMLHAMKFIDYVHDRGGAVALAAIEQPKGEWPSVLAAFEAALQSMASGAPVTCQDDRESAGYMGRQ